MNARHAALHQNHDDVARLVTSPASPVFWILDLEDARGFAMAEAAGTEAAQLIDKRDSTVAVGSIPAMTLVTSLEAANALIANGWHQPPLPVRSLYVAVVSDGRLSVRRLTK